MKVKITPSKCQGEIRIPPSKSYLHRALIAAALAGETSTIYNVNYSNDICETLDCLEKLGANFDKHSTYIKVNNCLKQNAVLEIAASATTLRLLIPILLVLFKKVNIVVKENLKKRPLIEYERLFKAKGLYYDYQDNLNISGTLKAGIYELEGDISSQFVSGLLFALPLLKGDSEIRLKQLTSLNYIFMTLEVLKKYGVEIKYFDKVFYIKGSQKYQAINYFVEADYSQAAFYMGLATINNDLTIKGLVFNSIQGDRAILDYVNYDFFEGNYLVKKHQLEYLNIDLENIPDLAPVLFILAILNKGGTFSNINRLKYKESDRVGDFLKMLEDYQVNYKLSANTLELAPGYFPKTPIEVNCFKDHRLVMAMSILASVSRYSVIIKDANAINKSYPDFFKDLKKLGIKVEII